MDSDNLISEIIRCHLEGDASPIVPYDGIQLLPQLDYRGKMARNAYYGKRAFSNKGRPYVGLLDMKIMIDGNGMEHEAVIAHAMDNAGIEVIRAIHAGRDPTVVAGQHAGAMKWATVLQAAFVEQELNWGEESFQLRTYFGRQDVMDPLLQASAPRDYFMTYLEKCSHVAISTGCGSDQAVSQVIEEFMQSSKEAKGRFIGPPIDKNKTVLPDFRAFVPCSINGYRTEKWAMRHKGRIDSLCMIKGPNPGWPRPR